MVQVCLACKHENARINLRKFELNLYFNVLKFCTFIKPGKRKTNLSPTSSPGKVFKRIIGQRVRGDKVVWFVLYQNQNRNKNNNKLVDLLQTFYNVQWKGQLLRTWEREESLSPGKIAEFLRTRNAGQSTTTSNDLVSGFQRCLEPERIIGRQNYTHLERSLVLTTFFFRNVWSKWRGYVQNEVERIQQERFCSSNRSETQMSANCDRVLWETNCLVTSVNINIESLNTDTKSSLKSSAKFFDVYISIVLDSIFDDSKLTEAAIRKLKLFNN